MQPAIATLSWGALKIRFPVTPAAVTYQSRQRQQTFVRLEQGPVVLPRGMEPSRFSWSGILPGPSWQFLPGVLTGAWIPPRILADTIRGLQATGVRCTLTITRTTIALVPVLITEWEESWSGGYGHCAYQIVLTRADTPQMRAVDKNRLPKFEPQAQRKAARQPPPVPATYRTVAGDTLQSISHRIFGTSARWQSILAANARLIPNPRSLTPGIVLRIPHG